MVAFRICKTLRTTIFLGWVSSPFVFLVCFRPAKLWRNPRDFLSLDFLVVERGNTAPDRTALRTAVWTPNKTFRGAAIYPTRSNVTRTRPTTRLVWPNAPKLLVSTRRNATPNYAGSVRTMRILLWTPYYRNRRWYGGVPNLTLKLPCQFTDDRTLLNASDAVLFHGLDIHAEGPDLPTSRADWQVWTFVSREPPPATTLYKRFIPKDFNGLFNWTVTYRSDSDIVFPYGMRLPLAHNGTTLAGSAVNYAAGRTKKVLAIVSNCKNEKRIAYVRALSEHIEVDFYGGCNNRTICQMRLWDECVRRLASQYKFFLAFESTSCTEYITEKYWYSVAPEKGNLVPVVMGPSKRDYERVAIPGSFIHVDDFRSARHLAGYLHALDKNDRRYSEFFDWRQDYAVGWPARQVWAGLCKKLLTARRLGFTTYRKNFGAWWNTCSY